MNGIIVECNNKDAVVLTDEGLFLKVKSRNYQLGETIAIKKSVKRSSRLIAGAASMAAAMAICTIGGFAYYTPTDYVSLDVNPSIEYSVNRFDRILDVKAVNDDGAKILEGMDMENMTIEAAVRKTMDQLFADGYFNVDKSGGVVITTSNKEIAQAEELAAELEQEVQTYLEGHKEIIADVKAEAVGMKRVEEARDLGVTPGKLNLVDELQQSTSEAIDKEEWLNMPVREINEAIRENRKSSKDQTDQEDQTEDTDQQDENIDQTDHNNLWDQNGNKDNAWRQNDQTEKSRTDSNGYDSVNTERTDPENLPWANNWNNHKDEIQPPRIATGEGIDLTEENLFDRNNNRNNTNNSNDYQKNKSDEKDSSSNKNSSDEND